MPASLVTDWKRVAQSGNTVDGRFIKPEWLEDMAETYDPKVYKAKIWLDHDRWSSYGSVEALKSEKEDDVVRLYAKISPSRSLLQMNQVWEKYLHFSIEVAEDFAKTGKTYLTGLAMTDSPASLGTDEMRFKSFPGRTFTAKYPGEPVSDLRGAREEEVFRTFTDKFFSFLKHNSKNKEEDDMKKEDFEVFEEELGNTKQIISDVAEKLDKFIAEQKTESPQQEEPAQPETTTTEEKPGEFAGLEDQIKTLGEKFDKIVERLEKAAPSTQHSSDSAVDDAPLL